MKVNLNLNQPDVNKKKVNFEGYKPVTSPNGYREYEFNYVYDSDKYDCYVELYSVDKEEDGNYFITGILKNNSLGNREPENNEYGIKLQSGKPTVIDLAGDYGIRPDQAFAYHYKLYPKNTPNPSPFYKVDSGIMINQKMNSGEAYDIYNVVPAKASSFTKGGAMKLIVPDINNVSWIYDDNNNIVPNPNIEQARQMSKNFANKIGGSLAGIEKDLEEGKLDNFTRIITLPLFTDDSVSAHGYWNKNCFQMAHSLGNINNYTSLQKKLFAKGINLVSDGAYVNEGLEGIHFQHVLKWGQKSPYFNWFKIEGLKDSPLSLGVFGKKTEHVTHRLVNSPYKFIEKPDGTIEIKKQPYDHKKPVYIQIYDNRLVNAENLSDKELIKAYDKLDKNYLDINNHNDTVIPYSFRINPETYKKNVENLIEYNKSVPQNERISLKSGKGTQMVTQFEYFGLDGKHESGFETWDANPDIAKLNFIPSHSDTESLLNIADPRERAKKITAIKRKANEVQDYAVTSAKYWTDKTNKILKLNAAQHLRNIQNKSASEIYQIIKEQCNGKVFPENLDVTEDVVKNVINDRYNLHGAESLESYNDIILQGLMDVPLDSIEVGDDIAAVLGSSYISKRAIDKDQIGVSRFEMYQNRNMHIRPEYYDSYTLTDKMYTKEMSHLAKEIFQALEIKMPPENKLHDEHGNATSYGKYVLPFLTAEIARFAIIKSVDPKAEFSYDKSTGELTYNYKKLKNTSLLSMGIIADSPEDEAISLINKIRKGIRKISPSDKEKFASALLKSIKNTNLESFKLAEMIVERSQAGLDWRIDATKDIADMESLKDNKTDFEYTWTNVIDFWTKFVNGIKQSHPHAFITAEVTDLAEIYDIGNGCKSGSRFAGKDDSVRKLIDEAGFTSLANYDYFSSSITGLFGKLFADENGVEKGVDDKKILELLDGEGRFLLSGPMESLIYTYTFAGNHDKCRALDGFAMDTDIVYTDLTKPGNPYRERAYRILNGVKYGETPDANAVAGYDYNRVSNLAIAKAEAISYGMAKAKEEIGLSNSRKDYVYDKMIKALANIANGRFKGKVFEAGGFGSRDYNIALDIVLDEMEYLEPDKSKCLNSQERDNLKKKTLEKIIDPAMSRLLGQTKFLVALLGNPTLFAGDEYGSTGYETTTKNITLQNRNIIHEEWADSPDNKVRMEFVKRFKDFINEEYGMRARKELEPLNTGAPYALKPQEGRTVDNKPIQISALLRQTTNGAMTISLFNTSGLNHKFDEYYRPSEHPVTLDHIDLSEGWAGGDRSIAGIKPGTKFINAKDPNDVYYVNDYNQITRPLDSPGKIKINDCTMILYSEPTFTGRRVMYNPQYNFVSKPYSNINKPQNTTGSKLTLMSR